MPEIGTSGSMSGDGKRSAAAWPKLPRPSSTLPSRHFAAMQQFSRFLSEADIHRGIVSAGLAGGHHAPRSVPAGA
jgi:hypothetical protein